MSNKKMTNKKIKLTADTIPNALAIVSARPGKMLNTNKIKEKKDNQKNKGYMSYRKKNKKKSVFNQNYDDSQNNNIEIEEVSLTEQSKGLKIDIFG